MVRTVSSPEQSEVYLILRDGREELVAVQVQVDVGEGVEELLGFPPVLGRVLHLQVFALGATQLLQVEVQHGRQAVYQ